MQTEVEIHEEGRKRAEARLVAAVGRLERADDVVVRHLPLSVRKERNAAIQGMLDAQAEVGEWAA